MKGPSLISEVSSYFLQLKWKTYGLWNLLLELDTQIDHWTFLILSLLELRSSKTSLDFPRQQPTFLRWLVNSNWWSDDILLHIALSGGSRFQGSSLHHYWLCLCGCKVHLPLPSNELLERLRGRRHSSPLGEYSKASDEFQDQDRWLVHPGRPL